jgi:hypothetical protein
MKRLQKFKISSETTMKEYFRFTEDLVVVSRFYLIQELQLLMQMQELV